MKKHRRRRSITLKDLWLRVTSLMGTPTFWIITLLGNIFILLGAAGFYAFESASHPGLGVIDSLVWSVGIVTTVGAGETSAESMLGKILSILMMFGGALFLWTYMALFVGALIEPVLRSIEKDVSDIQQDVRDDEQLLGRLKELVSALEIETQKRRPPPNAP